MFVKVTNGEIETYPYSVGKLRRDNPMVSFPRKISDEMLASYGVHDVKWLPSPEHDAKTHFVEYGPVPVLQDDAWVYAPTVRGLSKDQLAERSVSRAGEARVKRNTLLESSDWTQMNDSPLSTEVKTAWATYRQELRGLTDADEWPILADEDWPVSP